MRTLANSVGPLVSLALFAFLGNHWTIGDCALVLSVGQLVCFPAILLLCFFNDDDCPDLQETDETDNLIGEEEVAANASSQEEQDDLLASLDDDSDTNSAVCFCTSENRAIPVLIVAAEITLGLASGMSIRYFPVFFLEHLKLSPVIVQVIYFTTSLLQTVTMRTAQRISTHFGRCRVSASFKWTGICLMFTMILAYKSGLPTWVFCVTYVIRTAVMNSTGALLRSLLMDNVPKVSLCLLDLSIAY